jgi:hypothetical protein
MYGLKLLSRNSYHEEEDYDEFSAFYLQLGFFFVHNKFVCQLLNSAQCTAHK